MYAQNTPSGGYGGYSDDFGADAYPSQPTSGFSDSAPVAAGVPAGVSEFADGGEVQRKCPKCGRSFNPKPYQRHVQICDKVNSKREAFDMKAKRIVDPEQEKLARKAEQAAKLGDRGGKKSKKSTARQFEAPIEAPGGKQNKWKQQSMEFRKAMRASRQVTEALATGKPLPPPEPSVNADYIQCPNCMRRFNQKAGERHIPQCKNIKAQPKSLKRGQGIQIKGGSASSNGNIGRFR